MSNNKAIKLYHSNECQCVVSLSMILERLIKDGFGDYNINLKQDLFSDNIKVDSIRVNTRDREIVLFNQSEMENPTQLKNDDKPAFEAVGFTLES